MDQHNVVSSKTRPTALSMTSFCRRLQVKFVGVLGFVICFYDYFAKRSIERGLISLCGSISQFS